MIAQAEHLLQRGSSVPRSLLPAIFNILGQWRLTGAQQMTLLGLSNEKTLYNWKSQPEKAKLTRDLLERASYILGIYKSLQILLSDPVLADQWLATPNDNPLFNGQAPLDRLLAGQVVDLAVVRDFLDAERGAW
ncbi:MAG: MbcA/ParS/Xre antitoxin family protein [Xanthomonadaceae bacterium]|nr:MbcA/ParS/Xre antitoxin family protein [Xanthomonadaceae bacterium]